MTDYYSTLELCNVSDIYVYYECQQAIGNLWEAYVNYNYIIGTQQRLGSPMVWIGNYVAAASLACFLAIAVDTFLGLRNRIFWFPCKFFTLNAATLTLLAVAMKLPLDLSNSMEGRMDQMAKLSSTAFMCVLMTNFMPSLGAMDNKEILLNLAALGILVITVIVNVIIQLITGAIPPSGYFFYLIFIQCSHIVVMISMLMLLEVLSVTALTIPTLRKILQVKYAKIHKVELKKNETVTVEKLKENVAKYWMMAKTGNPQFVISRSPTCIASGTISLLVALVLLFALVLKPILKYPLFFMVRRDYSSDYKYSTSLIFVVQTAGVVLGTIITTFRCFTVAVSNCSNKRRNHKTNVFSVETYWIQRLLEWKESSLSLPIQNQSFQKLFLNTIGLILDFFIVIQKVIVVASKVVRCIYNFFVKLALSCHYCINMLKQKLMSQTGGSENQMRLEAESGTELDLRPYVLLLEGEEELPAKTLKNISDSLNRIIEKAKAQQPRNLKELVKKCKGFNGVSLFNSYQVLSLHSEEPPNGWSLAVATLTSIAIVLPSISQDVVDNLLCSVNESRLYIKQIEKSLDTKRNSVHTRKAADLVWFGVRSDCKWLEKDLKEMALKGKTFKENLDCLAAVAEKIITDFKVNINDDQIENPTEWPLKILAANTMYRISKTMSLDHETSDELTDYEVFEKISIMITDTIAACLTNLPRVIITKCYSCSIEKGEESVKAAARLLGETEEIMELVQKLKPPSLTADQMGDINEWSSIMKPQNPSISDSPSSKKPESSDVGEVQIVVESV